MSAASCSRRAVLRGRLRCAAVEPEPQPGSCPIPHTLACEQPRTHAPPKDSCCNAGGCRQAHRRRSVARWQNADPRTSTQARGWRKSNSAEIRKLWERAVSMKRVVLCSALETRKQISKTAPQNGGEGSAADTVRRSVRIRTVLQFLAISLSPSETRTTRICNLRHCASAQAWGTW